MDENFFEELKEKIQPYFKVNGSHGFDHTERVFNLANKIAKDEEADLDIIKASALLHDIAREKEDSGEKICHAEEGAKIAKDILEKTKFPKEKIEKVVHAIEVHRYSKQLKPKTKEAEIIQDADRLDALGAICIARVFNYMTNSPFYSKKIKPKEEYSGKSDTAINHFFEKILKIKPESFHTQTAKYIARDRYEFIEEFVKRFIDE